MKKKALVLLANGLEEIEAITIIDILRRGNIEVTTSSLDKIRVRGSHDIIIEADTNLSAVSSEIFDAIILPGGMPGSENLKNDRQVIQILKNMNNQGKIIAAICAAPMALYEAGLLDNKKFTMHPAVSEKIPLKCSSEQVICDQNIITGQASGAAIIFAFKIVENLLDLQSVNEINQSVLLK